MPGVKGDMMRALVIYETLFGNTRRVAEAIADGLRDGARDGATVDVVEVVDAPASVPPDVDLLVLGGPTHAFSMSRPSTRREAAQRGGAYTDVPAGIREWLDALPSGDHAQIFVAFDTRMNMPLLPGAASHAATRRARRKGFRTAHPESFFVADYEGPLLDGELDRAREWGRGLTGEVA